MASPFLMLAEAAGSGEHHEATLLGLGAEGWVYVGITLFFAIAIFGMKAHTKILSALDAQIAETRKSLDEAVAIRAEAEAVLNGAKAQYAAASTEAEGIVGRARAEADAIIARAEADTTAIIARREKMAEDKIAAAERSAVDDLRARAAAAAADAARSLIASQHGAAADKRLVDEAIASI